MSALGQKRTYAVQNGVSALLPIATAKADIEDWQTFAEFLITSVPSLLAPLPLAEALLLSG
jgi:hypothetical protein